MIELLEDGVDPCCSDNKQRTPLHFASSQGYEKVGKSSCYSSIVLNKEVWFRGGNSSNKEKIYNNDWFSNSIVYIDHYSIIVSLRLDAELYLYGHKKLGSQPLGL